LYRESIRDTALVTESFRDFLAAPYHVSIHDTLRTVLRPADLVVLLGLLRPHRASDWSVRSLAAELGLPQAAVQRSLERLGETPVYDARRRRVNRTAAEELLTRAVPYIAPGRLGALTRGVPTAWAAPPLTEQISRDELPPVWPDPRGSTRGLEVAPLHEAALAAARSDPWLYEMLSLVDGVRIGDARVRRVAADLLQARLSEVPA
jgi:hypothetical protein